MALIDAYIHHLVQHDAQGIEFVADQPIRFRFASGDRRTNRIVDPDELLAMILEVAPPNAKAEFEQTGRTAFVYSAGETVEVTLEVNTPPLRLMLTNAALRPTPAAPPPRGAPAAPPPAAKPAGGNTPPGAESTKETDASVTLAAGEPRIHLYLRKMIQMGASDLHLSSNTPPYVRLHGSMKSLGDAPLGTDELRQLLMEIAPAINREEFDQSHDTDFAHLIAHLARFRANYFMDRQGIGAVFRQIPLDIIPAEKLGLPKQVLDLCALSKGLVLVTGPTGSGKSTTLASLIDYINTNRSDHIITIEDPIEFVHANKSCLVNQREVGTHTRSFKNALRAALREDPDIVLVGELRDLETIAIAIETAETGHLVFGTLHTTTAPSTVDRIIDQFPADRQPQIRTMLSESLKGVIAQVLCRKAGGGRAAAYEILISNHAVANLIREGKTYQLPSVMQTGRNQGMQTMNEHFLQLVKSGIVEANEAYMKAMDKAGLKELFQKNNIGVPG